MTRAVVALLCAVAVAATGAAPAGAAAPGKARATCAKVLEKKTARTRIARKLRRACRRQLRASARRRRTAAGRPAVAPVSPVLPAVPVVPAPVAPEPPAPAAPPQPAPPAAPAALPVAPPEPAPAFSCAPSPWVGITAEDVGGFRFVLSRTCVPAGTVKVQLVNRDSQPHNVHVRGLEPAVAPRKVVGAVEGIESDAGSTGTGQVELAPGRWRFYCAIPGHEAMAGTVTAG